MSATRKYDIQEYVDKKTHRPSPTSVQKHAAKTHGVSVQLSWRRPTEFNQYDQSVNGGRRDREEKKSPFSTTSILNLSTRSADENRCGREKEQKHDEACWRNHLKRETGLEVIF